MIKITAQVFNTGSFVVYKPLAIDHPCTTGHVSHSGWKLQRFWCVGGETNLHTDSSNATSNN